jgi:hypothetical protein
MTDEEVIEVWRTAEKNVRVSCDENHAHSARQGCLMAKQKTNASDVVICILAETLLGERKVVRDAAAFLGTISTKTGNTT